MAVTRRWMATWRARPKLPSFFNLKTLLVCKGKSPSKCANNKIKKVVIYIPYAKDAALSRILTLIAMMQAIVGSKWF
jgi:hypothetical protein